MFCEDTHSVLPSYRPQCDHMQQKKIVESSNDRMDSNNSSYRWEEYKFGMFSHISLSLLPNKRSRTEGTRLC